MRIQVWKRQKKTHILAQIISISLIFISPLTINSTPLLTPNLSPASPSISPPLTSPPQSNKIAKEAHIKHKTKTGAPRFTNDLIHSKSTYLRQHAHQPVQWYSWGKVAFKKAITEGKLIFLSVGYATCHWCHVMARESFDDLEIAAFLNKHFVSIKVDRQEHPDVDDIYMKAVRALSRRGGWPMTVVLTPKGDPFFGGTYFPPRDGFRGSRRGFLSIIKDLVKRYKSDPEGVVKEAKTITEQVKRSSRPPRGQRQANYTAFIRSAQQIAQRFDIRNGGFGRSPKFPRPVTLNFLARYGRRAADDSAFHMIGQILNAMRSGGIWDHVGGGFHRYSVDARWRVPHFEKMLYDNAQLGMAYLEAWQFSTSSTLDQVGDRTLWRTVTEDILDYLLREMRHPQGALYAATDADSLSPEGEEVEGYFFTWTPDELKAVLTPAEYKVWRQRFHIGSPELDGRDVLYIQGDLTEFATRLNRPEMELKSLLNSARAKLYKVRAKRPAPILDAQSLTGWSALGLSTLAKASWSFDRPDYLKVAQEIAHTLTSRMKRDDGRLWRVDEGGVVGKKAILIDYAATVAGLLDLFEVTGDPRWLKEASEIQKIQDLYFWDSKSGVYRMVEKKSVSTTQAKDELSLIADPFPDGDYAVPSGISIATHNLTRWRDLLPNSQVESQLKAIFTAFEKELTYQGSAWPQMLTALDSALDRRLELVIASPDLTSAQIFLAPLKSMFLPHVTRVIVTPTTRPQLNPILSDLIDGKVSLKGKPTAYVCESGACQRPTTQIKVVIKSLSEVKPLSSSPLQSLYSFIR